MVRFCIHIAVLNRDYLSHGIKSGRMKWSSYFGFHKWYKICSFIVFFCFSLIGDVVYWLSSRTKHDWCLQEGAMKFRTQLIELTPFEEGERSMVGRKEFKEVRVTPLPGQPITYIPPSSSCTKKSVVVVMAVLDMNCQHPSLYPKFLVDCLYCRWLDMINNINEWVNFSFGGSATRSSGYISWHHHLFSLLCLMKYSWGLKLVNRLLTK